MILANSCNITKRSEYFPYPPYIYIRRELSRWEFPSASIFPMIACMILFVSTIVSLSFSQEYLSVSFLAACNFEKLTEIKKSVCMSVWKYGFQPVIQTVSTFLIDIWGSDISWCQTSEGIPFGGKWITPHFTVPISLLCPQGTILPPPPTWWFREQWSPASSCLSVRPQT